MGVVSKLSNNIAKAVTKLTLNLVLFFIPDEKNFVMVTGSDSSHFKSLCQFLSSLSEHKDQTARVVVYDLGLEDSEKEFFRVNFPKYALKTFDYSKYPSYFNVKVNAGEYAWKPVIFNEVMNEYKCSVCWMDAGNKITKSLKSIRKVTKLFGIYSPASSGDVSVWTHPKTLEYLNAPDTILNKRNLNGACISVNYENNKAVDVIKQWGECAQLKECIAPEGSGRHNHRQDQTVITVLARKAGIPNDFFKMPYVGFKIHQDID